MYTLYMDKYSVCFSLVLYRIYSLVIVIKFKSKRGELKGVLLVLVFVLKRHCNNATTINVQVAGYF